MTPSPVSKQDERPSKFTSSHSRFTSSLLVLNLTSNAASYSSLRPKRRHHHAHNNIKIHPLLKRDYNVSYFTFPIPSSSSKKSTSKSSSISTPCLPKILTRHLQNHAQNFLHLRKELLSEKCLRNILRLGKCLM